MENPSFEDHKVAECEDGYRPEVDPLCAEAQSARQDGGRSSDDRILESRDHQVTHQLMTQPERIAALVYPHEVTLEGEVGAYPKGESNRERNLERQTDDFCKQGRTRQIDAGYQTAGDSEAQPLTREPAASQLPLPQSSPRSDGTMRRSV